MPDRDGTGPCGRGPFTGEAMGDCVVKLDQENNLDTRGNNWYRNYSDFNRGRGARMMRSGCERRNRRGRACC